MLPKTSSRRPAFCRISTSFPKVSGARAIVEPTGPLRFTAETDRVYDSSSRVTLEDPGLDRRITIAKGGSHTTVVWNPWVEKSQRLADFGPDEYHGMVCVETANAAGDSITVAPGGEHRLTASVGVEEISD